MNIEAFLLCEAATDTGGKLNVLGAFDNIVCDKMPAVYPACTVTARIRFSKIEEGNHKVRIDVIDEDGKRIMPRMEAGMSLKMTESGGSGAVNLILHVQRLKFEQWGEYRIDMAIDGKLEASLPLTVRQPPNPTGE